MLGTSIWPPGFIAAIRPGPGEHRTKTRA